MTAIAAAIQRQSRPIGTTHRHCPLCDSYHLEYEFIVDKSPVCGCQACGLLFLNPQPEGPPSHQPSPSLESQPVAEVYETNAMERLEQLIAYSGLKGGRLVSVGTDPYLSIEATKREIECLTFTTSDFEALSEEAVPRYVDACILFCALETVTNPLRILQTIRQMLGSNGTLMVVSPTTDSRAARLFRSRWWEFRRSNSFYFSVDTLQSLLLKAGFGDPIITPDKSVVSLNYLKQRLAENPKALRRRYGLFRAIVSLSPLARNRAFRLLYGRTRFLVRCKSCPPQPTLSVIVPAYNERATFEELMERLLAKTIDGMDIEVIVVESNSRDGTREVALRYQNHARVRLILEDKPSGKGHAVRAGLAAATGDFIIIQDADLEYDINDYDALLLPLVHYQRNFVLGSRHVAQKNSWKIRDFADSSALAAYFNLGHLFFLKLFNLIYSQQLTDPFTMFKVFRRECLYGLAFESARFDFDIELTIRLLRKGYKILEIPVNYKSRSVAEGKKVTLLWDPLTWLWAYAKYRFAPLYDKAHYPPYGASHFGRKR